MLEHKNVFPHGFLEMKKQKKILESEKQREQEKL